MVKFISSKQWGGKNKKLSGRLLVGKEYNEMLNILLRNWKKAV
jgi:protein gp37